MRKRSGRRKAEECNRRDDRVHARCQVGLEERIEIHYDYTGIENWATARWKTNNDLTRSYKETMQAWSKRIGITFVKVEAHKGIEGNERADGLAKKGLSMEPGVLPV